MHLRSGTFMMPNIQHHAGASSTRPSGEPSANANVNVKPSSSNNRRIAPLEPPRQFTSLPVELITAIAHQLDIHSFLRLNLAWPQFRANYACVIPTELLNGDRFQQVAGLLWFNKPLWIQLRIRDSDVNIAWFAASGAIIDYMSFLEFLLLLDELRQVYLIAPSTSHVPIGRIQIDAGPENELAFVNVLRKFRRDPQLCAFLNNFPFCIDITCMRAGLEVELYRAFDLAFPVAEIRSEWTPQAATLSILSRCATVKRLTLDSHTATQQVMDAFDRYSNLTELCLLRKDDKADKSLCRLLLSTTKLTFLNIVGVRAGEKHVNVKGALVGNTTIQELGWNFMTKPLGDPAAEDKALVALADVLPWNHAISTLYIGGTCLDGNEARSLALALRHRSNRLDRLTFSYSRCTESAVDALCDLAVHSSSHPNIITFRFRCQMSTTARERLKQIDTGAGSRIILDE
jgi:hypothetical protein